LKQAKEEAQDEIEKYRQERERQFKEFEAKVSFRSVIDLQKGYILKDILELHKTSSVLLSHSLAVIIAIR
jgi:hypothetical protein